MAREPDDDSPRRSPRGGDSFERPPGPLDGTFGNTNIVVLILFGICCGIIAFILSLVCVLTATNPKAKSNATLVMIISGVLCAIGLVLQVTGVIAGLSR